MGRLVGCDGLGPDQACRNFTRGADAGDEDRTGAGRAKTPSPAIKRANYKAG